MPERILVTESRIKRELDKFLSNLNEDQLCIIMEGVGYSKRACDIKSKEGKIDLIKKRFEEVRFRS